MDKKERYASLFVMFATVIVSAAVMARLADSPTPPTEKPADAPWRTIVRVLDGDTLELDGKEMVRLIGVDSPESAPNKKLAKDLYKMGAHEQKSEMIELGHAATRYVKYLAEGRECWLEHDAKKTDMYGRTIAYVHLRYGPILNENIIAAGYGRAYLDYPFKYKKRYIELQAEARAKKRGLWEGDMANIPAPVNMPFQKKEKK